MKLRARFIVPGDGPAIENAAMEIRGATIHAVGRADHVGGAPPIDYGDAVILPGFVNAHTHLELSYLAGKVPPRNDFVDWLYRLVDILVTEPVEEDDVQATVRDAVLASLSAGVTTIGDVTRSPAWTRPVLARSPIRAVSFGEVIAMGAGRARLDQRLAAAASQEWQTDSIRCGISPHSPYTVEPSALAACAETARQLQAPLCIHAAESTDEMEFTQTASGRLASFLKDVGVWDEHITPAHCTPIELCSKADLLTPRTLLAHANYVCGEDLRLIAASGASVAYCPRTHAAFGHAPHRFRDMLRAGVSVAIGTDSLASNPSLSVLDELRFLRERYRDVDALELVRMGTLRGAVALGLADATGSLTPGKAADLVVMPLEPNESWESVLQGSSRPLAVYTDGVQTSLRGYTQA